MGRTVIQIVNSPITSPRIVFWGMDGDFSRQVLENFLEEGPQPAVIVLPDFQEKRITDPIVLVAPETPILSLPLKNPYLHNSIFKIAWEHHIPVYNIRDLNSHRSLQILKAYAPALAIVACFPKRIPRTMLDLPDAGFLNLHPSLLPSLRGPFRLFWTFRLNMQPGLTVHFINENLDSGDIVLQKSIEFADGVSSVDAETILAKHGAALLAEACHRYAIGKLTRTPQQGEISTYSRPMSVDFSIPTSWTARHAFNFIRGTADWGQPFLIYGPDIEIKVRSAVTYDPESAIDSSLIRSGADVWVRFADGVLHARK